MHDSVPFVAIQGEPWFPPPSNVPYYVENSSLLETDEDLQNRLIQHLGQDAYDEFTGKLHTLTDLMIDVNNEQFVKEGCQGIQLGDITPAPNEFVSAYLDALSCEPNFQYARVAPDYFPAWFGVIICDNAIVEQTLVSFRSYYYHVIYNFESFWSL